MLQPDGKVLVGGATQIGGQNLNNIARLSNNIAALQSFSASQTTISWTTDGSTPLFSRVTYEQSTDGGATYTPLGSGTSGFAESLFGTSSSALESDQYLSTFAAKTALTPQATSWTLSGQNLPTGQNVLIRARGYYRGGYKNGSESIVERVQNVFFPTAPTAAGVSVSGRVMAGERGVSGATVVISDSHGANIQTKTNAFGYYRFDEVKAGQTYIVQIRTKRYQLRAAGHCGNG